MALVSFAPTAWRFRSVSAVALSLTLALGAGPLVGGAEAAPHGGAGGGGHAGAGGHAGGGRAGGFQGGGRRGGGDSRGGRGRGWGGGYYPAPPLIFGAPSYCAPPVIYGGVYAQPYPFRPGYDDDGYCDY